MPAMKHKDCQLRDPATPPPLTHTRPHKHAKPPLCWPFDNSDTLSTVGILRGGNIVSDVAFVAICGLPSDCT